MTADQHLVTRKLALIAAGLRNRLVHDYDDLDPHRVFDALQAAVVDVPRYVAAVQAHLARPAG